MSEEIINVDKCGDDITIETIVPEIVSSINGRYNNVVLNRGDVGLSDADNTADLDKPLSNATIFALMSSVNWDAVYNHVYVASSDWINQKIIDYNNAYFVPLSGNAMITGELTFNKDFYVWGNIVSGGRSLVDLLATFGTDDLARTLLMNGTAYWDSVFSNVNYNSAGWNKAAYTINNYLPLSGGICTDIVTLSGFETGDAIYSGEIINDPVVNFTGNYIKIYVEGNIPRYIPLNEI